MISASRTWIIMAVLASSPVSAEAAREENAEVERTGDYLQVGIPLVALGLTFLLGEEAVDAAASPYAGAGLALDPQWPRMNGSPRHDLLLAVGRTELATYTLKYSVDEQRPNGGGQSFPSGHTSMAFAGAEFIRKEYGWGWGAPSYLAASYVGWSRVETHNHWTRDVLAGAAIGILSNHDGLGFSVPFGQLTIAPSLMMPAMGRSAFDPPDSARELLESPQAAPVPGVSFELRF